MEAIKQIAEKLAVVNEYIWTMKVVSETPGTNTSNTEQIVFRRPGFLFSKETQFEHVLKDMIGQLTWNYDDGKTRIVHTQKAQGSEKFLIERMQGLPEQSLQDLIKKHRTPKAYKYDLNQFRQAGIEPEIVWPKGRLINPFSSYDPAKLRLAKETEDAWEFSARPRYPMPGVAEIRVTIRKKDGVLRKIRFYGSENSTMSFSEPNINPEPKIDDQLFIYKQPPGTVVKDSTPDLIESLKGQFSQTNEQK